MEKFAGLETICEFVYDFDISGAERAFKPDSNSYERLPRRLASIPMYARAAELDRSSEHSVPLGWAACSRGSRC